MSSVLVGMFDSQAVATQARSDLLSAGFAAGAVTMTGGTSAASDTPATTSSSSSSSIEEPHHEGAIARFFDSIFGGGSEEKDSLDRAGYTDTYSEAFKRGSFGVSVTAADDDELDTAERILNDSGAVDIDEQAESWRKDGWTGGSSASSGVMGSVAGAVSGGSSQSASEAPSPTTLEGGGTRKLQELQEELVVGKRTVAKGGVRVFTRMTEVPVTETVRLREERAEVQRTVVDRPATEADFAAFKEGSIEVRESAEEAVVSKTARVTGEVEVGKTATEREETIRDTVRKTEVDVEQIDVTTGKPRV